MNRKIIIVEGYLASGKSTFALRLSKAIHVPYLIKDTFKIALCESVSVTDRHESSRFSAVTFDAMMYVTERMFEAGYPIIIEGNFVPAGVKKTDESMRIQQLINQYGYKALTFKFMGTHRPCINDLLSAKRHLSAVRQTLWALCLPMRILIGGAIIWMGFMWAEKS